MKIKRKKIVSIIQRFLNHEQNICNRIRLETERFSVVSTGSNRYEDSQLAILKHFLERKQPH